MKTIKERAAQLLKSRSDEEAIGNAFALLQELVDAPEPEPALVVEVEPDYWHRGHYCEGSKPYINPLEVWKLPVGTKLYTAPPAPSVPDVANAFKRRAEEIVAMAMNRDNYAETNRLSAALIMDIANAAEPPAESPEDVVRDAELLDWLEQEAKDSRTGVSIVYKNQADDESGIKRGYRLMRYHQIFSAHSNLRAAIDAAMSEKGGA